MANEKNYVGSGFEHVFSDGGSVINCRAKLSELPVDDEGFVKFVVGKKRNQESGKPSHWIAEDTFVPKPKDKPAYVPPARKEDDLPF